MARRKKTKQVAGGSGQSGELVNQHKRFAMGENVPQGKVLEKKK